MYVASNRRTKYQSKGLARVVQRTCKRFGCMKCGYKQEKACLASEAFSCAYMEPEPKIGSKTCTA